MGQSQWPLDNGVLTEDYLNLSLVRLKPAQQWVRAGEGVAFLFPCGGGGQYARAAVVQPLSAGDVLVSNLEGNGKVSAAKSSEFAFWAFSVRMEHLFPLFAGTEI